MTGTQLAYDEDTLKEGETKLRLQTAGDMWRSYTGLLNPLVDECKVRFDDEEGDDPTMSVRAVDPANVGMVDLSVPAEAFDGYQTVEGDNVLGLSLDELTDVTDYARKGGTSEDNPGDPVVILKTGRRVYVDVLPDDRMNRRASFFHIDPDSMRQEPDLPDLSLPWEGQVDVRNLRDALKQTKKRFDHVKMSVSTADEEASVQDNATAYLELYACELSGNDGEREISKEDGFRSSDPVMENVGSTSEEVESLFSLDYLTDMFDALVSAGVETGVLRLGDDFPLRFAFSESRFGFDGEYMLAPRIRSDEDGGGYDRAATWEW